VISYGDAHGVPLKECANNFESFNKLF